MKNQRGITLTSLLIVVVLLIIITGTTVYTSTDRLRINDVSKMQNDIELLNDKVSTYYLKYSGLPILKDNEGNKIEYASALEFSTNVNDGEKYYIIDLKAVGDITLNYGEEGYAKPNESDDVYVINEKTHSIYYVRGIEYKDGTLYHSKKVNKNETPDTVPPTKPKINIISGALDTTKINTDTTKYYTGKVIVEFVPGKDNWSGVRNTTYSINEATPVEVTSDINTYTFDTAGTYTITVTSNDNSGNQSTTELVINIS